MRPRNPRDSRSFSTWSCSQAGHSFASTSTARDHSHFCCHRKTETTQVDRALAAELNVKPQTRAGGGTQIDVTFELGTTKTTVTASVADIAQSLPEFGPAALPRGIISLSMWEGQLVTIDYSRWRVTIQPGVLPDADGKDVFELSAARELTVPLSVAERSVPCRIDPLFAGGIVVPASFVKEIPLAGRSMPRSVKTPKGVLDVQEARLTVSARLGGLELPNPVVQSSERLSTAMVGGQALTDLSITYDLANRRARLDRPEETIRPRVRSTAEVSAPRFDDGRRLFDANLQPAPLVNACGLNGEDVLLAELVEESGGGGDSLQKIAARTPNARPSIPPGRADPRRSTARLARCSP